METLKKFYDFAVICIYVLASIGGTSYLLCDHHFLFGIANLAIVAMAFPYVRGRMKGIEE